MRFEKNLNDVCSPITIYNNYTFSFLKVINFQYKICVLMRDVHAWVLPNAFRCAYWYTKLH